MTIGGRSGVAVLLLVLTSSCTEAGHDAAAPTTTSVATVTTTTPTVAATTTTLPVSTEPAAVIDRGNTNRRVAALTFDAGADTGYAAQILDTLAAANLKATFGLTGRWADENPDLVRRMAAAGHDFINHTYDHRSFTGVSAMPAVRAADERRSQLDRTDAVLTRLTGRTTRPWFRPPYGDYDRSVNVDVGALGYRYNVLWTVDSLGWQGLSAAAITSRCLRAAEPGAIYLFHVGRASQDAAALPAIITGLRDQGYAFATVAELIAG